MCASALSRFTLFLCVCGLATASAACSQSASPPPATDRDTPKTAEPAPRKLIDLRNIGAAPTGRRGEQLPEAELDAALVDAAAALSAGNRGEVQRLLTLCANKIPASARCDGRFGLFIAQRKRRRKEAIYYLAAAATTDDPKGSASLYGEIGEQLRRFAQLDTAVAALANAVKRENTIERQRALADVLVSIPARLLDAADILAQIQDQIRGLPPNEVNDATTSDSLLLEEAIIRAQIPAQLERAIELFEAYRKQVANRPDTASNGAGLSANEISTRIGELNSAIAVRDEQLKRSEGKTAAKKGRNNAKRRPRPTVPAPATTP